jgi:predicted TIM-barrel fold metal-dependent hydrolase
MEIFDCYCGVGPWQTRDRILPYTPDDIIALMNHFGMGRALVHSNFTAMGGSAVRGNLLLGEACRAMGDRFVPAFSFPPSPYDDSPGVAGTLKSMREAGAKAVWFVGRSGVGPARWVYGEMFDACVAHRLPLLLHRDHATPEALSRLLEDFPKLTVVLLGTAYADDWWLYPLLRRHDRLHVSIGNCYVVAGNPERFLRHFPSDRLLFGSGLPFFTPGGIVTHIAYSRIPDPDRAKLFGGNLARLIAEVQW